MSADSSGPGYAGILHRGMCRIPQCRLPAFFIAMRITLAGTAWTIKRLKRIVVDGEDCDGSCCRSSKTLEVRRDLEGVKELEILIHECRHALNDYLDEHYVDKESKDLAGVLWRLGYRKQPRRRG